MVKYIYGVCDGNKVQLQKLRDFVGNTNSTTRRPFIAMCRELKSLGEHDSFWTVKHVLSHLNNGQSTQFNLNDMQLFVAAFGALRPEDEEGLFGIIEDAYRYQPLSPLAQHFNGVCNGDRTKIEALHNFFGDTSTETVLPLLALYHELGQMRSSLQNAFMYHLPQIGITMPHIMLLVEACKSVDKSNMHKAFDAVQELR